MNITSYTLVEMLLGTQTIKSYCPTDNLFHTIKLPQKIAQNKIATKVYWAWENKPIHSLPIIRPKLIYGEVKPLMKYPSVGAQK